MTPPVPTSQTSCHDQSGPTAAIDLPAFSGRPRDDPVQDAHPEIPAVEHDVDRDHDGKNAVPQRDHSVASWCTCLGVLSA